MSEPVDLKAVKTKIHRTILDDGLLEIMMGIYLVLSGIYLHNKSLILIYLWLPIALVLIEIIRRRYVYPRSGYAKISLSTFEIIAALGSVLIGITILTALIALISASMGHPVEGNWRGIISYALIFFLVISFCYIAYRFNIYRWYMHGISTGIVFLLSKTFDAHELVFVLGIWITLVGVVVFLRYLRQFPIEPNIITKDDSQAKDEELQEFSNAN